ncbi:hypothetical protein N7454_001693 [Penicillium verhagenii]|nr:hypothetical protein N7454_001693 [Penicillium verhagenii]
MKRPGKDPQHEFGVGNAGGARPHLQIGVGSALRPDNKLAMQWHIAVTSESVKARVLEMR